MRLRPLAEADLAIVWEWMRDAPEAPAWKEEELVRLIGPPATFGNAEGRLRRAWVAEDSAEVLQGFAVAAAVLIAGAPAECELEFIFVPPAARRSGVGRALLQAVLEWARQLPACEVWLEVRASNARAIEFYQMCGFAAAGRRPRYYVDPSEDAVLMRCGIDVAPRDAPV